MLQNMRRFIVAVILIVGIVLLTTGFTDIDWMVNQYHNYDYSQVEVWYFTNKIKVDWWMAYANSVIRLIAGSMMVGFVLGLGGLPRGEGEEKITKEDYER